MTGTDLEEFASFAEQLADTSRAQLRATIGQPVEADPKGDGSPVTAVDRAVEAQLREMIAARYPDHGIIGEEHGATAPDREWVWALDPIDGTLPFLAGIPVFGTLIALLRDGVPLIGVIDMPATEQRWLGCRGRPSTLNGAPVRTRTCAALSTALVSTSNPDFYSPADRPALDRLNAATRWTVYGGSCMAYAQLAAGRIDLGMDVAFDPYDYLALVPVIEGAGGRITDWRGEPLTLDSGDRILAAGDPARHAEALAILAGD
jgi:histidinol phosphatase-like enzyme (inositol monophosphatase family)